jgi:hypothetical protein
MAAIGGSGPVGTLSGQRPPATRAGGFVAKRADEAVATTAYRLDAASRLRRAFEHVPDLMDRARQHRLAHESAAPHGVQELTLRDDALSMPHEVDEHVEVARRQVSHPSAATELVEGEIELEVGEREAERSLFMHESGGHVSALAGRADDAEALELCS